MTVGDVGDVDVAKLDEISGSSIREVENSVK